jgi:ABC-type thiamine transport system ATPase subunit
MLKLAEKSAEIASAFHETTYDDFVHNLPQQLSGGQLQK